MVEINVREKTSRNNSKKPIGSGLLGCFGLGLCVLVCMGILSSSGTKTPSSLATPSQSSTSNALVDHIEISREVLPKHKFSISYRVAFNRVLPTRAQLKAISDSVARNNPGYERYFLLFYLPGMFDNSAAFATAHRDHECKVEILSAMVPDEWKSLVEAFYDESADSDMDSMFNVKVLQTRIEDFASSPSKVFQKVIVTWKNTGTFPIRVVDAKIETFNASGKSIGTYEYTIYATSNENNGIRPGETYFADDGFIIPGFRGSPMFSEVAKAKVTITKADSRSAF